MDDSFRKLEKILKDECIKPVYQPIVLITVI